MPKTATLEGPKPEQIKPDLSKEPQHGDNGPSKEEHLFFAGQFRAADERIKEARDARKKLRQAAKNRGVEVQLLDEVIKILDEDDNTELERLRTKKKMLQDFDHPLGSQYDLFDGPVNNGRARAEEDLIEKAKRDGYQRGVAGLNLDDQAYPPALPEGLAHLEGWNAGQDVNKEKLLKLNEELAAERAAKEAKKRDKAEAAGEEPDDGDGEPEPAGDVTRH